MPVAIPFVAAALSGALAAASGATILGLSGWALGAAVFAANIALSFITQALSPKPKTQDPAAQPLSSQGAVAQTVRQAAAPRPMIFGKMRIGGIYTFLHTTNTGTPTSPADAANNGTLHMVVTLAGHPVKSIDAVILADQILTLDAGGKCTGNTYLIPQINPPANAPAPPSFAGHVECHFGLGTAAGDADFIAALKAACPDKWTDAHRQSGCAKVYLQLTYAASVFPGGIPNPSFLITGYANVEDPRVGGSPTYQPWTDNAALCIAQYLRDVARGMGYLDTEIDAPALIAAANSCDEMAPRGGPFVFTASAAADTITLANAGGWTTGQKIFFQNTGGALPGGLAADTAYYWIDTTAGAGVPATGQVSASLNTNNQPGSPVDITSAGSGVNSIFLRTSFTVDAPSDVVTLADTSSAMRTGTRFTVASVGGSLPGGLAAATEYFWIARAPLSGKVATSLVNARAGIAVDLTSAGSGTLLLLADAEPRYTLNGLVDTSNTPQTLLPQMLAAMAGRKTESGGKVLLFAGVWQGIASDAAGNQIVIDESVLDGGVTSQHRRTLQDVFNGEKGTFIDPDNGWNATDFPAVQPAKWLAEDGGLRKWKDAQLIFTNSPTMAQRVARIDLERTRRQITVALPLNLNGLRARACDTIGVTNAKRGWTGKTFDVARWQLQLRGSSDAPRLGVDLACEETDAAVYAWSPGTDEATLQPAPRTSIPSPFLVPAPTALSLASGTNVLAMRLDGTIFSRILLQWSMPASGFVTSGGVIEIEYRLSAGSPQENWRPLTPVRGDQTNAFILDVDDGKAYDVRIRAKTSIGATSAWLEVDNYTVLGKSQPPTDVSNFSATQNGTAVNFHADQILDLDLDRIEIRYQPLGDTDWATAAIATNITRGASIATASLQPGNYTFLARAVDTTGNLSTGVARADLTVANPDSVIYGADEAPDWLGLKTNCERHYSGSLVPLSTKPGSAYGWETFDQPVPDCVASFGYKSNVEDTGLDDTLRVFATEVVTPIAGVSGSPTVDFLLDHWKTGESDPNNFVDWTSGSVLLRYFRSEIFVTVDSAPAYVASFKPTADKQPTTEQGANVVVAPGGSHIVFSPAFHSTPVLKVSAQGGPSIPDYANPTASGFDFHIYTLGGADNGGTGSWEATGT